MWDVTDIVTASVDGLAISGTSNRSDAAAPSDADLLAMLSISPTAILDNSSSTDTLSWTFDSDTEFFNYLADGETLILEYTIEISDDNSPSAATDSTTVTITITGTNDAPVTAVNAGDSVSATLSESNAALSCIRNCQCL